MLPVDTGKPIVASGGVRIYFVFFIGFFSIWEREVTILTRIFWCRRDCRMGEAIWQVFIRIIIALWDQLDLALRIYRCNKIKDISIWRRNQPTTNKTAPSSTKTTSAPAWTPKWTWATTTKISTTNSHLIVITVKDQTPKCQVTKEKRQFRKIRWLPQRMARRRIRGMLEFREAIVSTIRTVRRGRMIPIDLRQINFNEVYIYKIPYFIYN